MSTILINGAAPLSGRVRIHGAKNALLPIMAAAVLPSGKSVIHDCPRLSDVVSTVNILRHLGCETELINNAAIIDPDAIDGEEIPYSLMCSLRSSVIFLGALLGKMGRAVISYPGGCELGPRPIDLHIKALCELGVKIEERDGFIFADARGAHSGRVHLDFPSVGATENVILTAVKLRGETVITNAAKEPEICDLANYLNRCGAKIRGAGGESIRIEGVASLTGCEYTVIPDRIVAATYLCAVMAAGGEAEFDNICPAHMDAVFALLRDCGAVFETLGDRAYIAAPKVIRAANIVKTQPYPGFPTDAQSLIIPMLAKANGSSVIVENIFENRYKILPELAKMGADVVSDGRVAVVRGVSELHAAHVTAQELRGGAALVIAGVAAKGESTVDGAEHILRGYGDLCESLSALGAKVSMI